MGSRPLVVLGDVHANYGALRAVFAHATAAYGEDLHVIQLGDLANYGPRPAEVVAAIRDLLRPGVSR